MCYSFAKMGFMSKKADSKKTSSAGNWQERSGIAWWLVGFVDGEGTFSVNLFRNKTSKLGWQCFPEFVITQGRSSIQSLDDAKSILGCGRIYINKRNANHREHLAKFCVRNRSDLKNIVVPFFRRYPLRTKKRSDFDKFSNILDLMDDREHLNPSGLKKIAQIIQTMNTAKESMYLKSSEAIR